jgi:hypothetical protein
MNEAYLMNMPYILVRNRFKQFENYQKEYNKEIANINKNKS